MEGDDEPPPSPLFVEGGAAAFTSEHQSVLIFFPTLCLFLIFEPFGLLGIWLRIKRYFMAWPFRY